MAIPANSPCAPAIGVSGAMGLALGIQNSTATTIPALTAEVAVIADHLAATRPTAVNLFWGIGRIRDLCKQCAEIYVAQQGGNAQSPTAAERAETYKKQAEF